MPPAYLGPEVFSFMVSKHLIGCTGKQEVIVLKRVFSLCCDSRLGVRMPPVYQSGITALATVSIQSTHLIARLRLAVCHGLE
jgi:hypothetical protein